MTLSGFSSNFYSNLPKRIIDSLDGRLQRSTQLLSKQTAESVWMWQKGKGSKINEGRLKAGLHFPGLGLFGSDCVFCSFGHAELAHGLGWNFDGLTRLGIASHASFTVLFYQTAQARNDENAIFFGLFNRCFRQML